MKTGAEILKTFRQKDELAIIGLAEWDYTELIELKKRYWVDYSATSSEYLSHRVHLINEAITLKRNIEEIPYTL